MMKRYERQIGLPQIGLRGQKRLLSGSVLVIGLGGLGSPAALYLTAGGVGRIGIVDCDRVELGNLQRQILYGTGDVGSAKTERAARALQELNPEVKISRYDEEFNAESGMRIAADYDFVIDATDNLAAKFSVADVCHALGKPYSYGGVKEFVGQTMTVLPGKTCCLRCVFAEPSDFSGTDESVLGPVGPVPGVIGCVQALEAMKCIAGFGELMTDGLLIFDGLSTGFRTVHAKRRKDCCLCGKRE